MMKAKVLLFLVVGLICTGSALAINVPDGDLDTPVLADGTWDYVNTIRDTLGGSWSHTYYAGSPWIANNYSYVGYDYPGMGHTGAQWVDLNAGYIHQTLTGETYQEGVTYELSIWAKTGTEDQGLYFYLLDGTNSDDGWSGATTLMGTALVPVPVSDWTEYSATYEATAADAGKTIAIAIYGRGATYGDTVTLTPEPMTLGLLGLGALMLRRRKR